MNIKTIITAGGTSSRFGNNNKLLEKLCGKEVIKHTVNKFLTNNDINEIIICANETLIPILESYFKNEPKVKVILGGENRQESVYKGLSSITECDYILIHDGARPLISNDTIQKIIDEVKLKKAVTVMTKTTDTIKEVDENNKIIKTIDRTKLYNTQTPQAFEFNLIKDIHETLKDRNFTDDASMVECCNHDVYIVNGDYKNIKITTQNDISIASVYLENM